MYGDSRCQVNEKQALNKEIREYEVIERVNVLDGLKPKSILCQPIMVFEQMCNQNFFLDRGY